MSFEYPEDWNIRHYPPGEIDENEHVMIQKEGERFMGMPMLVLAQRMLKLVTGSGPLDEIIGDVHCTTYYDDSTRTKFYVFQKNGRTFLVACYVLHTDVAEDIIKSLKAKK